MVSDRIAEPFLEPRRLVPPRHHLRRPPGELRGRARQPRRHRARGPARATCWANEDEFRAALDDARATCPIVGEVRGMGYFYGIELAKNGDRSLHRRRVRAAAPRLPLAAPVRARPHLPGRRPRRPGDPAVAAADRRPRGVRRDRATAPPGAARGVEGARPVTERVRRRSAVGVPTRDQGRRAPGRPHPRRRPRAGGARRRGARAGRRRRRRQHPRRRPTGRPAPRSSPTADEVWARAGLVCKVKEPQASRVRATSAPT